MANYKETNVNSAQWQRCKSITIRNEYMETPIIYMQEEVITVANDTVISKLVPLIDFVFNPADVVELLNPTTGESLGQTMTFEQIYVALWSLYMSKAAARDEAERIAAEAAAAAAEEAEAARLAAEEAEAARLAAEEAEAARLAAEAAANP